MAKRRVAERNVTYRLRDVEQITIDIFNQITKEEWQSCVQHVKSIEERYMQVRIITKYKTISHFSTFALLLLK